MTDALLDEILEEIELDYPRCVRCRREMVSAFLTKGATREERIEWWSEGYEFLETRGHCQPCSWRIGEPLDEGELERRDGKRLRHLHYIAARDQGMDLAEAAKAIGITKGALVRNIETWTRKGWL